MVSAAPGGTADRIAARILFKVPRAGSGTPARYSSTFFGARFPFAAELRLPDFTFFMGQCYKSFRFKSMPQIPQFIVKSGSWLRAVRCKLWILAPFQHVSLTPARRMVHATL